MSNKLWGVSKNAFLFIAVLATAALFSGTTEANDVLEENDPVIFDQETFDYYAGHFHPDAKDSITDWKPVTLFDPAQLNNHSELWIRIQLPEIKWEQSAVSITAFLTGFEVYLAADRIYSYGNIPDIPPAGDFNYYNDHLIELENIFSSRYLFIRIFYSDRADLGEIYSVAVGEKSDLLQNIANIRQAVFKKSYSEICLGFLLFIIGTGSVSIFILRWKERDYPFLSFGIFSLCAGITYLSGINASCFINVSPKIYYYLKTISFLLVPAGLFAFVENIFGAGPFGIIRRIWQFHLAFAVAALFLTRFNINYDFFIFMALTVNCSLNIYLILKSGPSADSRIKIIFVAFFCLFICLIIFHILEIVNLIPWTLDLFGWGMLLFVFALGYVLVLHYKKIFLKMRNVSLELEKNRSEMLELQKEKISSQLEALKNQIDPHFLFNNFSTLASIIEEDQETAVAFVQDLSNIYRYVLQTKVKKVVVLEEELDFIESYRFLMSKRFGDNLRLTLKIPEQFKKWYIVPFSLQLLVENAIKHNIISIKKPLYIEVVADGESLTVKNNLQKKTAGIKSANIGLINIQNSYRLIADKQVEIIQKNSEFIVRIPLLDDKYVNS